MVLNKRDKFIVTKDEIKLGNDRGETESYEVESVEIKEIVEDKNEVVVDHYCSNGDVETRTVNRDDFENAVGDFLKPYN